MTDNEIIKALECCVSEKGDDCENCPYSEVVYRQGEGGCTNRLMQDALDLINRQKAEIERLEKGELQKAMIFNSRTIKNCTTDAIKEFAERLKNHIIEVDVSYGYGKEHYTEAVPLIEIENLVKEMTEVSDNGEV